MTWAVRQKLPCTQKIVLLMLAERHNGDTGQCNPSHDRLTEDCGLSRRSVIDQISKLADAGYIRVHNRAKDDLKLPNQYTLVLSFGVQEVVQEVHIDVHDVHYSKGKRVVQEVHIDVQQVHGVVQEVHGGSAGGAHKPVIEPVIEPVNTNTSAQARPSSVKSVASVVSKPDDVDDQVWVDFLSTRKAQRAPLTATAVDGIRIQAGKAGLSLDAALRMCCERGWRGFKAEWVEKSQRNGSGSAKPQSKHAAASKAIFDGVFND